MLLSLVNMQEVEAVTSHISHEEPLNAQFRNYASFIWYISRKEEKETHFTS